MTDYIDDAQDCAMDLNRRALTARLNTIRAEESKDGRADCEDCEGAISAARLKAVPSARRCAPCQRLLEMRGK